MVEIDMLKDQWSSQFNIKDLRATKKILEMEIHEDKWEQKLFLSHKCYTDTV